MSKPLFASHSADVKMWLDCGEHGTLPLSRVTPTLVVARECREIAPCFADLVVTVDGVRLRQPVNVTTGFTRGRRAAIVVPVDGAAPF